ncbi:MAG TPA: TRAFs-binding domain-containing protein [Pyrinomonadaceae bacterium]|jgi:class 3 adenylate cyclase
MGFAIFVRELVNKILTQVVNMAILTLNIGPREIKFDMVKPAGESSANFQELIETLAESAYGLRARQRVEPARLAAAVDDATANRDGEPTAFPPYEELPESEKQDYRNTAIETLKLIRGLGYRLEPKGPKAVDSDGQFAPSAAAQNLDQIASLNLSSLLGLWQARSPEEWANTPGIYRRAGRRVLKLGEPLVAYDILTEGLKNKPRDVELRQLLALALARSGATQRANAILTQLRAEGHRDEETLGILARTHKDLWMLATTKTEAKRQLKLAHKFYHEAYKLNRGYYSAINAATLAVLLGNKDEARTLAQKVREACLAELKTLRRDSSDRYWPVATLGEASLILRQWSEAEDWYAQAAKIGRGQFADLSSTRRNARLLVDHLRRDATAIEQALKIPGIVVFAGHLIDRADRSSPRFPASMEAAVRAAIRSQVKKIAPGFGYASAGCGADILFLETLLDLGGEAHVVLPFEKEQFIHDSVGFANSSWVKRFESVLERAASVIVASNERIEEGSMSFEYANLLLYGLADIRARQLETDLVPLAVWDKQPGDGPGGTAGAVEHWKKLGLDVQVIDLSKILKREGRGSASLKNTAAFKAANGRSAPRKKRARNRDTLPTRIMAMLFADAVNFSKLTEQQIPLFLNHFLGAIGRLISTSPHAPSIKNTWGDGLYFVFDDVKDAGLFALELCELMVNTDWSRKGLPKAINLRIALHAGPVYSCVDPVTEQPSYTGTHVSRAARIEPITPPGQVYGSQAFAALAAAQGVKEFTCDYVGQTPLAKGYGTFATYHVRCAQPAK